MIFRPLAIAMGTLTTVRVPIVGDVTPSDLAASTAAYPLIGATIGVVPTLVLLIPGPTLLISAFAIVAWVLVTGALHLDGVADCGDAALAPDRLGREKNELAAWRRELLKDPHVGTFGVVALILLLVTKWASLASIPSYAPYAPTVAAATARYSLVLILGHYQPAKSTGLAASFGGRTSRGLATVVFLIVLIAIAVFTHQIRIVAIGAAIGILTALASANVLSKRFGGITGDVCGASAELSELAALLAFVPWHA